MAPKKKKIILKIKTKKTKQEKEKGNEKGNEKEKDNKNIHKNVYKYTKYYPSILEPNFSNKIANHGIFKKYKLNNNPNKIKALYNAFETNKKSLNDDSKSKKSNIYILKPTQKLLRNFMSPYTPYRGLLIYHEMGVGKTCTAITIAEALKQITINSKTKIYVIRPDEIVRQVFDIDTVRNGNPLKQCTGDTYLQTNKNNLNMPEIVENCSVKKNEQSCEQLKKIVDKEIKQIYEFIGAESWANVISKEINLKTKGLKNEKEIEDKERQIISKIFNNAVIIVDEAHDLRYDSNDKDKKTKVVPPILNKVLKYSSNLRLIFLTATPIYDKPQNIISIINYFLLNDKRKPLKENEIFYNDGNLKPNGRQILEDNTRGYVSYLRGNNPYDFPIRLLAKYNIPDQILDLNNYPKKDINGNKLNKNDTIKHLELVDCPLQKNQLEILNYHIKNNKIPILNEDDLDKYSENDLEFDYQNNDNSMVKSAKLTKKIKLISKSKSKSKKSKSKSKTKSNSNSKSNSSIISNDGNYSNGDSYDIIKPKVFAYQFESQLSNFVFQSLDECNKNTKFASGTNGLEQVTTKQHNKWTYEFNDPEYGKRFRLPELQNWGIKIAKVVERVIANTGRSFIYTGFIDSGVIPIVFALEMNGFRRYKQHNTPILENKYKDKTYRGDYIIYTGNASQSLHAKYYIDKRSDMIKETNVKVFIGTSKASQGLNLFGYREAHIIDPWHNINLIEQSIGRVIRTGSHLHLPPQDRNVTVYQYATTMGDRESFDLKIYKICENKAIKAGVIEKILKENAFDCVLNKDVNFYDMKTYGNKIPLITSNDKKIRISLADAEYSRSCFYMKDCDFKCSGEGSNSNKNNITKYNDIPIMKFNYEKDVEEYKNLIIQLMQTSLNIKIDNLKEYLKNINKSINTDDEKEDEKEDEKDDEKDDEKYYDAKNKGITKKLITLKSKQTKKYSTNMLLNRQNSNDSYNDNILDDEIIFDTAIQDIINTDVLIIDRLGRKGNIILSGEYLRFVPLGNLNPNISIQKQQMKIPNIYSQINLKEYISILNEKQKSSVEYETKNYDEIMSNSLFKKTEEIFYNASEKDYLYNVKLKFEDILEIIFTKLICSLKIIIIKTLLEKIVNNVKLSDNEKKIEPIIKNYIIYMKDIYPNSKQDANPMNNIYGFIIQNESKLELFEFNKNKVLEKTLGNLNKVIEYKKNIMNKTTNAQIYGFLKYEKKDSEPVFKITDTISKGEKKSVRGQTCNSIPSSEIKKTLNKLDDKLIRYGIKYQSKFAFCNDVEVLLRRNDLIKKNGKKWFYTPEEHYIMFEYV